MFVTELSRIGVCTFLPIDGAVSIRKEELILDEFLLCNWFCECHAVYCLFPLWH